MNNVNNSICIIAHNAYGVLAGVDTGHSGGIEVQTPLMAKWLAENSCKVSMITWDEGIQDTGEIDGVKVIKLCRRDDGVRILRFFHPRWSSFNKALRTADADLYYYNCGDLGLGQLVLWARRNSKKVVYSVANEKDCYRDLSHLCSVRDREMYRYGLLRADRIIVQTIKQKELLKSEYGLESIQVPMPSKGYIRNASTSHDRLISNRPVVLWIGRFNKEKRLEWFIEMAKSCPEIVFEVIGDENIPTSYGEHLKKTAKSLPNIRMHGRINHDQMGEFYMRSALLCSTSIYEGFPNVYLEAWSTGLPVLTTFDPDGIIKKYGLGMVACDVSELIEKMKQLLKYENHSKYSISAKRYFLNNHEVGSSMKKYLEVFNSVE